MPPDSQSETEHPAGIDRDHGEAAMGRKFLHSTSKGVYKPIESCSLSAKSTCKVLLLYWKTILLLFGDMNDIETSKAALRENTDIAVDEHEESFITASPLDYHLFRQEITSKYPAYNPPPPLVPIELENNSILPPLPSHVSRQISHNNLQNVVGASVNGGGGSIFHQPVHIATPAPSPPPSPAGPGGKGGKKQNYQTNQNFPFLYPPLDDSSNTVGGKGKAELQDQLVGKRWEGSDVPASILEAGQLFASRMRMSRSIRQLWDVREKYIKYERGWNDSLKYKNNSSPECSEDEDEDEESNDNDSDDDVSGENETAQDRKQPLKVDKVDQAKDERETDNKIVQDRLNAVNEYYVCIVARRYKMKTDFVLAQHIATSSVSGDGTLASLVRQRLCPGGPKWPERDLIRRRRARRWTRETEDQSKLLS